MKKYIMFFLIVLLIPFAVTAKEYCKVINGNGKELGSEIACGSEHFYIINSNNDEIKMLAKYNLKVGEIISKIKIEKNQGDSRTDEQYCSDLAFVNGGEIKTGGYYNTPGYCYIAAPIYEVVYYHTGIATEDGFGNVSIACNNYYDELNQNNDNKYWLSDYRNIDGEYICRYYRILPNQKQSEDAKSAHWDSNDNYIYPQIGDVYLGGEQHLNVTESSYETLDFIFNDHGLEYENFFYDLKIRFESEPYTPPPPSNLYRMIKPGQLGTSLINYKNLLTSSGFTVNNIDLLSFNDINQIALKNGKTLPYVEWKNNILNGHDSIGNHHEFGFLNNYLPKGKRWLYNTTYWLKTGYGGGDEYYASGSVAFITSAGGICGSSFSDSGYTNGGCDYYIKTNLGCGIRPVITIPNELQYMIKTKIDGNGTIEVVENALGGEKVTFKTTAKKGYKITKLIVITASGEKVEFTEGEIIYNKDGTISIDKNKFTMPYENVTIEAKWSIINPKTLTLICLPLLIVGFIFISLILLKKKKQIQ